jgi:hypothetical protein
MSSPDLRIGDDDMIINAFQVAINYLMNGLSQECKEQLDMLLDRTYGQTDDSADSIKQYFVPLRAIVDSCHVSSNLIGVLTACDNWFHG